MWNKINYEKWVPKLILCAIGIALIVGLLFLSKTTPIDINESIKTDIWGNFGTVIGGIVGPLLSLAGIFLLIETLNSQREAFVKQQVASHFFELLKIQRDNSINIQRIEEKSVLHLMDEFEMCLSIVKSFNDAEKLALDEVSIINVAYLCFLYGAVGDKSVSMLKNVIPNNIDIDKLSKAFEESGSGHELKYFDGNQKRLGHYYRHLYQIVKFIDEQDPSLFSYEDKYKYIKNVRAQLSTQEQVLLFYNSLSKPGETWERGKNITDDNKRLITKYNLIKNIPDNFAVCDHKDYYRLVVYEGTEKTVERLKLEGKYS